MSPVEVWVGPWRPHRPRGPIAAMYNSPGPTYALPGATGMNNHDPRMQKGPAFSFGTRHRGLQANSSPGPGYLVPSNITRVGRDGTPAYSVYGRPKDIQPFQTPGPGLLHNINTSFVAVLKCSTWQNRVKLSWLLVILSGSYSPENATKTTYYLAPAFSLSARTKLFRNDQTPGPAAYMLPPVLGSRVVNKASAPNVSFSGRSAIGSFHEDLRKVWAHHFTVFTSLYVLCKDDNVRFFRLQAQGPIKWWIHVCTNTRPLSTASPDATSLLETLQRNLDLEPTIQKGLLSQYPKLPAILLEFVTRSTLLP
uniref:Tripartite motif containing 35-30 n=1 Tax=Cyprinus carpio TaxID=7962 RepID=A0A8C1MET6_CYPCA